ncbi:MAG: O-antigen polymerase, partial [Flavobacteriaceae bacterium]
VLLIFLYLLFNKGLTFKGGIAFGLLFFIFIPVWVMIFTGQIELSKADFGSTILSDVVLVQNIKSSFLLLGYIFFIIIYLYLPSKSFTKQTKLSNILNLKFYLLTYAITMMIILLGSGLLKGGNWYYNRHEFFENSGSFAILIAFVLNASKILLISTLINKWLNRKINIYWFFVLIGAFTFWDMFFSGNRIYLFCTAIIILFIFLKRYPLKSFVLIPLSIPLIFYMGYFASIFRHIRGPLFAEGFPTMKIFMTNLKRAMVLEPPKLESFFLGISESVNVNVIYDIFNYYDNYLWGATYLKTLFFYVPRSLWESKPESITLISANTFGGSSLVTTIIGEMQMNFSFLGMFLLPVLLWTSERIFLFSLKGYSSISGIILFFFGLLIFRMPFSDEFLVFVFLVGILRLGSLKFKIKNWSYL